MLVSMDHTKQRRRCASLPATMLGIAMFLAVDPPLLAAPGSESVAPDHNRRTELVRLVRQDCGSCHGLTLRGGLGPALLPESLRDRPAESLRATIEFGRPGTPMPPWRTLLTEGEIRWIVDRLIAGFPEEPRR